MNHSSEEDNTVSNPPLHPNSSKRRRVQNQRACDRCRQKKSWLLLFLSIPPFTYVLCNRRLVRCMCHSISRPSHLFLIFLQVMELHPVQNARIVHRLAPIAYSQSQPRCVLIRSYSPRIDCALLPKSYVDLPKGILPRIYVVNSPLILHTSICQDLPIA